ncbi:Kinesin- protein 6 [Entophlyctis sp. JEL0112]|nr:Kinesin- protein 6 [Entophlyctis sp. JEL0112]
MSPTNEKLPISARLAREDDDADDDGGDGDDASTTDSSDDCNAESTSRYAPASTAKQGTIKIFVRVRPPHKNSKLNLHTTPGRYYTTLPEQHDASPASPLPRIGFRIPKDVEQGLVNNQKETYDYAFNRVFDQDASQEEVFDHVARDVILSAMEGYNGTIFAYGQTGSGKTFTITGGAERYSDRGIIPRTLQFIFKEIQARSGFSYTVGISYLEIYNENGYDLLDSSRDAKKLEDLPKVRLQEDENQQIHVQNLSNVAVVNEEEALNLLFVGDTNKMIAETPSNPASSRSHCIFIVTITGKRSGEDRMWKSKLHLVDLAGSERTSRTGISGNLFKEASSINLSLHYLEHVIVALHEKAQGRRTHIPYRNSMMTSILRDSLGGNCMTTMISTVAPEDELIEESISTCRFAQRVALISNRAEVNEEIDPRLVIARLKREIIALKAELAIARGEVGDDGDLPEYELERVRKAVEEYLADCSNEITLVFSDARKIKEAYRFMKETILSRNYPAHSLPSKSSPPTISDSAREELKKLEQQLAHRDNEITILVGMINKLKTQLGDAKLLDSKSLSFSSRDETTKAVSDNGKLRNSESRPIGPIQTETSIANPKPQLPPEKAKLFDMFKKEYPGTELIEEQKSALRIKYAEAKRLGETANELRLSIRSAKDILSNPDDGDEENSRIKRELRSAIAVKVSTYKSTYQNLKDLKVEIDHMQHLLEQGRIRLSRAFEMWLQDVHQPAIDRKKLPALVQHTQEESCRQLEQATSAAADVFGNTLPNSIKPNTWIASSNSDRTEAPLFPSSKLPYPSIHNSPYSSASTLCVRPLTPSNAGGAGPGDSAGGNWPGPVAAWSSAALAASPASFIGSRSADAAGRSSGRAHYSTSIGDAGVQSDIDAFYRARASLYHNMQQQPSK